MLHNPWNRKTSGVRRLAAADPISRCSSNPTGVYFGFPMTKGAGVIESARRLARTSHNDEPTMTQRLQEPPRPLAPRRAVDASDVKLWHVEGVGEAARITGTFGTPRKLYPELVICVLEKGGIRANYRRATHALRSGTLILIQPGECAATEPIAEAGDTTRAVLHCSAEVLQNVAEEVAGRKIGAPFFPDLTTNDPQIASQFLKFQRMLEGPVSPLESSSRFRDVLVQIILRRASPPPKCRQTRREPVLVKRVREYLDEHYADSVSLEELARMVNLSPFHLNRVFRMEVGLPPHAYQTQVRVMRSKSLLAQGIAIDRAAVDVGFFDQSHFTNHFRRLMGYTPGIYRQHLPGFDREG
jgi:AraC-like DNA-binding protein